MKLVIAEKPSVARDIADALPGSFEKKEGYLQGDNYLVAWSVGHLVTLAPPEYYHKEWSSWKQETLPMIPDKFALVQGDQAREQLKNLRGLLTRKDLEAVINACDAGREGELIFDYVYRYSKSKIPVERLWLSSMTKTAITQAFNDIKPASDYDGLRDAANCRSQADWLIGMNATRAATIHSSIDGVVSIGRVQSPTLAILARREREIRDFIPEDYWVVHANFQAGAGAYKGSYKDGYRFENQSDAEQLAKLVENKPGIAEVSEKTFTEKAPLLYDLTSLQRDASRLYGITAARTLEICQMLYEQEKAITYPRTDSRFLSSDMEKDIPGLLTMLEPDYEQAKTADPKLGDVINDDKVTDHHAIIVTDHLPINLGGDFGQVYDLIARRFIAVFYPAAEGSRKTIKTVVENKYDFISKGKAYSKKGWLELYENIGKKKQEELLPDVKDKEQVKTIEAAAVAKQTKPPKRYSDGLLLAAMESAGKEIDDIALRESMKERGLGTPATRAAIIERLIQVGYVRRENKMFWVNEKGLYVTGWLEGNPLFSPELTGDWESRLIKMEAGQESAEQFMNDIKAMSETTVKGIFAGTVPEPPEEIKEKDEELKVFYEKCPGCGKPMYSGKKAWSCWTRTDPGCGFAIWKTLAKKRLSQDLALKLVKEGKVDTVQGFKSKMGKEFDAKLAIKEKDGKLQVVFDEEWANRPQPKPDKITYFKKED
jgi:DNA topoisomerase-3